MSVPWRWGRSEPDQLLRLGGVDLILDSIVAHSFISATQFDIHTPLTQAWGLQRVWAADLIEVHLRRGEPQTHACYVDESDHIYVKIELRWLHDGPSTDVYVPVCGTPIGVFGWIGPCPVGQKISYIDYGHRKN